MADSNDNRDSINISELEKIDSPVLSRISISGLYRHLLKNSELSSDSIYRELKTFLSRTGKGNDFFLSPDMDELDLGIEEISFIIQHNRYQEMEHTGGDGKRDRIEVNGKFPGRYIFFISDSGDITRKTVKTIEEIIKKHPGMNYRIYSYPVISNPEKKDIRKLYILEEEPALKADPEMVNKAKKFVSGILGSNPGNSAVTGELILNFISSAANSFVNKGIYNRSRKNLELYFYTWAKMNELLNEGEDIYISISQSVMNGCDGEKTLQIWLPREKFQENFETINNIFERRGLRFRRQYFETFILNNRSFIALTTCLDCGHLSQEVEEFITGELYNRLILLQSSPVSVGEIRNILDSVKRAKDYEKLNIIDVMQKNNQKEYLIPLVYLLNDGSDEIRNKSFGLIKHYLLNPAADMKNDYYWSTLKCIMTAAMVPLEREPDRPARPLTDEEIINLIKFRDIYYDEYSEPVTGSRYLFIRINGIGIGKGGIRADENHVTFSGEGALSTNMLFKTLGIGIPAYTTGKGGILGDLVLRGVEETKRKEIRGNVLKAYADFLYYKSGIGPLSDVPAGDVGIGGDEIGIIFERVTDNAFADLGRLSRGELDEKSFEAVLLKENFGINTGSGEVIEKLASDRELAVKYTASAITGKPGKLGLALRDGATGRGLVEVLATQQNYNDYSDSGLWSEPVRVGEAIANNDEFYIKANRRIKMLTFSIQGFGKVGASLARFLDDIGATIKMISDATGTLVNDQGIGNISGLYSLFKNEKRLLSEMPVDKTRGDEFIPGDTLRPLEAMVNVVVPCALEDVIINREKSGSHAINVRDFAGEYLLQGANGPASADAEEVLTEMGKVSFPDILANSGGVLASYLEWINNLINVFGYSKVYSEGLVHPILQNVIQYYHPNARTGNIKEINEKVYEYAFRFILRWAMLETIRLSRTFNVSLRTAYTALGIRLAAKEGRLSNLFKFNVERMRDTFCL